MNILSNGMRQVARGVSLLADAYAQIAPTIAFTTRWAAPQSIELSQDEQGWSYSHVIQKLTGRTTAVVLKNATWTDVLQVAASIPPRERAVTAVNLIFRDTKCYSLKKTVPAEGRSKAFDILRFELERATPFKWDDVSADCFLVPAAGNERGKFYDAHLVLIKNGILMPLLNDIRHAGLRPAGVLVENDERIRLPVNLLRRSEYRTPTIPGRLNIAIAATIAAAALVIAVNIGAGLWRQHAQLEIMANLLSNAQAKAVAVRKAVSEADAQQALLTAPRIRRIEGISVLQTWEELTRAIPGTAWLTTIRLDGKTVQIEGYAQAASELISMLSAVPIFSKVEFVTPVIRDTQVSAERFQIRLQVERNSASASKSKQANTVVNWQ